MRKIIINHRRPSDLTVNRGLVVNIKELESIKMSIREHGLLLPPIINRKNEVIDGRKRVLALQEMGINNAIPVYVLDIIDEQIPDYAAAFNACYQIGRNLLTGKVSP